MAKKRRGNQAYTSTDELAQPSRTLFSRPCVLTLTLVSSPAQFLSGIGVGLGTLCDT